MFALAFPPLDPVAISLGPVVIRWYALAYLAGFILGWRYCLYLAKQNLKGPPAQDYDDFLTWGVIGTVIGGRLGYVFFYQPDFYFEHPLEILQVWHGGMSFHGGIIGVIAAALLFVRKRKRSFFPFMDILACAAPIGLGLGRIANFINGELYGRVSDLPWAVIFPRGGDLPRHPSQLYEGLLEGVIMFGVLFWLSQKPGLRGRAGLISGVFLLMYGLFRFAVEFTREPDAQLGYLYLNATMGQWLCVPMILFGLYLVLWSERRAEKRKD